MNAKTPINAVLAAVTTLAVSPVSAADPAPESIVFSGEVTPKLYSFDYFKDTGPRRTQFLERYNYQEGGSNDSRSGLYLDADLRIIGSNEKRDVFVLERQGFGAYNHRGMLKANSDTLGLAGYYSNFRTSTGGLNFLRSPGVVDQVYGVGTGTAPAYATPVGVANTQTGYAARFNNDDSAQTLFKVDRTSYGLGLALKPTLFGTDFTAVLNYDGYKRDGNRFATYVLGGSNVTNAGAGAPDLGTQQRWRGFNMPVDEKMNRYTVNLSGVMGGVTLAYDGSVEKFESQARKFTIADIASIQPLVISSVNPIHFVPDSTLIANNLRFATRFGSTSVAAGYGLSILEQDSFSTQQRTLGYDTGKIRTDSAYLNVSSSAINGVGLEGFIKYNNRDNDSSFPVVGLIDPAGDQTLGVRINSIKSLNYGLAATFRPSVWKTTMSVGWRHEDKDRDLTWSTARIPLVGGLGNVILAQQSFYREQTKSDELYLSLVSRPMQGMILRVTPSYLWADETGLVAEPEKVFGLKTKLTYTASNGMLASGYYNYRDRKNGNNSIASNTAGALPGGTPLTQDMHGTQQSAGASLNMPVSEWINTTASLSWMQDDFASYYLRQGRRRFEAPNNAISFIFNDRPEYKVDTHVLTLGGNWQVNDLLRYNGDYAYSKSKGHTATGDIALALPEIDERINNTVHTLTLGVDYEISKKVKLKGAYVYEYYSDQIYHDMTSGYHALMFGVTLGF